MDYLINKIANKKPVGPARPRPARRHIIRPGPRAIVVDVDRSSHCPNALLQLVRTHDTAPRRRGKVPLSTVRRDNHLALREMPRIRPSIQVPEMRLLRTLEGNRNWRRSWSLSRYFPQT